MGGQFAGDTKIAGGANQAGAKEFLPEAIDRHARRERMFRAGAATWPSRGDYAANRWATAAETWAFRPLPDRGVCRTRRGKEYKRCGSPSRSLITYATVPRALILASSCWKTPILRAEFLRWFIKCHQPPVDKFIHLLGGALGTGLGKQVSAARPTWPVARPGMLRELWYRSANPARSRSRCGRWCDAGRFSMAPSS